jgi:hypothetical protein
VLASEWPRVLVGERLARWTNAPRCLIVVARLDDCKVIDRQVGNAREANEDYSDLENHTDLRHHETPLK